MKAIIKKIISILKPTVKKIGLLLLLLAPVIVRAAEYTDKSGAANGSGGLGFAGSIIANYILMPVINFLGGTVLLFMINITEKLFSYNGFLTSNAVQVGWPLVRDFCNMFFVVILLMIAFSTILNIQSYHYKSSLPKLLIMAILINFSKTIMGLMIDFGQVIMLTFVAAFKSAMASNLVNVFGLADMLTITPPTDTTVAISSTAILVSLLLAVVFLVVACGVMLAYVAVLLYRILSLWVLVVLSPLAFFFSAFPGGQKYSSEFWSNFFKQLTTGAVLAFFMWLALTILSVGSTQLNAGLIGGTAKDAKGTEQQQNASIPGISDGSSRLTGWDKMFTFVVAIAILLLALKYAGEAGGFAGAFAGKVSSGLSKLGTAALRKGTGYGYVADRYNAYRDYRKKEKQQKIAQSGAWLASIHGKAEEGIGKTIGKPFMAARKKIEDKIGFTAYKETLAGHGKKMETLEDVEKLRKSAKDNKAAADEIKKKAKKGKLSEEETKQLKNYQDLSADQESEANYRMLGYSSQESKLRVTASRNRTQAEDIRKKGNLTASDNLAINKFEEMATSKEKEADSETMLKTRQESLSNVTTLGDLAIRSAEIKNKLESKEANGALSLKEGSAERILLEQEKEQVDQNIAYAYSQGKVKPDDKVNIAETKESLNLKRKQSTFKYLEDKKAPWILKGTRRFWDAKAEAAEFMQSQLSYDGKMEGAEQYGAMSRNYRKKSKLIGAGTTVLAGGAAIGGAALGIPAPLAAVALLPKFAKYEATRFSERGHRQKNLASGWKYTEIKHEMDDMKNMHITQVMDLAENKDGTVPALQQIAAILKKLEEGWASADEVEQIRQTVHSLGADERTTSHVESQIFEKFPNFVEDVKKKISIGKQIELGIIDPKKIDGSALLARDGELAAELAINLTFQGVMSAIQKSKKFKDNFVEGVQMNLNKLEKAGAFDDAGQYGELGKIVTRMEAAGKKDDQMFRSKILVNDKGKMAHEDFWHKVQGGKDGQNPLAFIRWDKMEKDLKEKFGEIVGEDLFKQLVIKFLGMTKVDHLTPAAVAAAEGDDPSQKGFARVLEILNEAYKSATADKPATIEEGADALKRDPIVSAIAIDTTQLEDSIKNITKMFGVLEGITSSNRLSGSYDFSEIQGNNYFRKSNVRARTAPNPNSA